MSVCVRALACVRAMILTPMMMVPIRCVCARVCADGDHDDADRQSNRSHVAGQSRLLRRCVCVRVTCVRGGGQPWVCVRGCVLACVDAQDRASDALVSANWKRCATRICKISGSWLSERERGGGGWGVESEGGREGESQRARGRGREREQDTRIMARKCKQTCRSFGLEEGMHDPRGHTRPEIRISPALSRSLARSRARALSLALSRFTSG